MSTKKVLKYLSFEQAEKLTTPRLLSYYKKISRGIPDPESQAADDEDLVLMLAERELHRAQIKKILDSREHVNKK